jgi:hypothetical protein
MPYLSLKLPPGISRPGTKYDARGRWYDANLVRWHEGAMLPIGGWRALHTLVEDVAVPLDLGSPVRGMLSWRSNTQAPNVALGTKDKVWQYANGVTTEITPTSFTAGGDDSTVSYGNYGQGAYGAGPYGVGLSVSGVLVEVQSWAFDTFGQNLIACAVSDGKLYMWSPSGVDPLTVLANAPVNCAGVVVTPERFVVALGAGGDARMVQWSDQEAPTVWTPTLENQAGSFPLVGSGQIMAGRRGRQETLIWTDTDLYAMRFIGGTLVYSFPQLGSACGLVSRRGVGIEGGRAFWMGVNGFFMYDGAVRAIPCEVHEHVFGSINRAQLGKVACELRSAFNEVTWYYPTMGENDAYVSFNYVTNHWTIGRLARTAGVDAGVTEKPLAAAPNGRVYEHEAGELYPHHVTGAALVPYAESGPVELGQGDHVMVVREIVPDDRTLAGLSARIYASIYPTAAETAHGPFEMANPTYVRLQGRWVRLRVDQASPGWRLGTPRLEVVPGGKR